MLATLVATCGCDSSRNPSTPPPPSPPTTITASVVGTLPGDGAVDVGPDAQVFVTFSEPVRGIPAGDLVVADGGGPLPGALQPTGDGLVWRWTGERELPRGGELDVVVTTTAGTSAVASFTVREAVERPPIEVPGVVVTGVASWPNGRSVVICGLQVFEVVGDQAVARILQMPALGAPIPFGESGYVYAKYDGLVGTLVRGDLDGDAETIAMPTDATRIAANARGDVVALVLGVNTQPEEQGLTRLRAGETEWQLAGSLPDTFGDPCIDGDGNVMIGFVKDEKPQLVRFELGDPTPQTFTIEPDAPATTASFGVGEDGVGVLTWLERAPGATTVRLRAARFLPKVGLQPIAGEATAMANAQLRLLTTMTARNGSTLVVLRQYDTTGGYGDSLLRIERDGWFGSLEAIGPDLIGGEAFAAPSRSRGAWWRLQRVGSDLVMRRSRPGAPLDPARVVYTHSQLQSDFLRVRHSVDDSGRALIAVNETASTLRIVRLD